MNKIIETSMLLFFLSSVVSVQGKIADPKPIINRNVRYESHRHTVWATDIGTEKVLCMFEDESLFQPQLLYDTSLCASCMLSCVALRACAALCCAWMCRCVRRSVPCACLCMYVHEYMYVGM